MRTRQPESVMPKRLLAGGSVLLAFALLMDFRLLPSIAMASKKSVDCQETVQPQAQLSRDQLTQLLTIAEGNKKQRIREIVKEPYCKLADIQIRTGATAQREAYPLAFAPQISLILLYEGDQYAGYRYSFE